MDNLAAHKVAGVREAIRAVGASVLYLPPYSPDLNPIEQLFAKLKALLRSVAARTKDALWPRSARRSTPSRKPSATTTSQTAATNLTRICSSAPSEHALGRATRSAGRLGKRSMGTESEARSPE